MMDVQVDVSTRCNFDFFYCAGREMAQGDMPLEQFRANVDGPHGKSYDST